MVGAQPMSKYDFGLAIARTFGFDPALISPASVTDGGLTAARSPNLSLDTSKLKAAIGGALPDFEKGLLKFNMQYRHGFPQYIRALV